MPTVFRPSSSLSGAFDALQVELLALDRAWRSERERSALHHTAADIHHHVCAALATLETCDGDTACVPSYHELDRVARVLAHEAFLAVLALGQLLQRAAYAGLAPRRATELATLAVERMLDELTPCVSRADDALRRVLLDDEPLETALAGGARGQ